MAGETLTGDFYTPSRSEIVEQYQRDFKFRQPDAPVGEGSNAYIRANVIADALMPVYANATAIANDVDLENKSTEGLDAELARLGLPARFAAIGGSGYVTITASAGGGTIFEGDEIKDPQTGFRFQCVATKKYVDGEEVPVEGIDTGTDTNLPAGTVLRWASPRPGIGSKATVYAQPTGAGLEGGRGAETNPEVITRIKAAKATPPAAGNDAEIQKFVTETPGVPVQAVFTYPAAYGPGTTCYAFTLAPATVGASRSPNAVQIAATRAYTLGKLPKDDGIIDCLITEVDVDMMLRVRWSPGTKGWTDALQWPPYIGTGINTMTVSAVTDALNFEVYTTVGPTAPIAGANFAFFDQVSGTFKRKRVLSSSVVDPFTLAIVCDPSNGASDLDFVPVVGDVPCPWSDALDSLVEPVKEGFDGLGPGEMFDPFFDEGLRQKRSPAPPAWPNELGSKSFRNLDEVTSASSIQIVEPAIPYETPVGTPGVSVNLLVLGRLSVFPA
jgi:uncharacterized phage protein gp47/JayE